MYILLFLLIFVIVIAVLGLSIVGALLRAVFGLGRRSSSRPKQTYGQPNQQQYRQNQNTSSDNEGANAYNESSDGGKRKKIFSKDEGEYVDFEEMK